MEYDTNYGKVSLETLIRVYHIYKKQAENHKERRKEYLQSDEGKIWNRQKAKNYYERNKEKIMEKRKLKKEMESQS